MKKRTQKICAQLMEWSAPTERQEIEESLCELASLHCPREVWAVVQAVLVRVNREVEHLARTECPCVSSPSPSKRPKTEQGRENTPGEARRPSVCAEQTEKIEGWVHKVGSVCIRKCEYLEEEEHRAGIRLLDSVLEGCLSLARHKSCVCLYGLSEKLAGIAAVLSRPKEEHEQQHVGGDVDRDVDRDDGDVGGGDGDVGGGARTSLDLLCKLSQMWTPEDTKTVQGIKYVQEICTHAPKTERRKASSFFCRLLRTGCLSGMHALCMHALEKDIHSLEDLLHLFGTEHIEADMLRLPIEDRSSVDLLLVGAVYLYYKRTSLHPLIAHLEEACTEWLEDKPLTFEVCISGCMHSLVVFVLGMLVHVSGSTERVSSPRLLWSLKAAVSFLYGTHTDTDVVQACAEQTEDSLLYLLSVATTSPETVRKHFHPERVERSLRHSAVAHHIWLWVDPGMCGMCEAPEACMLCLVYSSQFEKLAQHTLEKPSSAQGYAARLESLRYRTHVPAVCTRTGLVHVLDLGRVFAAPREVQILPKYTPGPFCREAVSRLFPSAAQRTAFFLFVESTLNAICCTSRVLTTEFERAVLLRAPEITRAVCRAPSRERLERITALAVEVLEGAADVSKKEKESTYRALCMVVSRAPSPALRDDITAYLKKKLPCTVLSAYLAESAGLSPGPLLCGGRLSSTRLQRAIEHSKDLVYMLGSRAVGPCAYRPCIVEKAKCLKVLEELTPSEEFIVRCFFKAHNLCLASLQRSTELLFAPESVVGQYVARHYTPSLQRHTVPNTTSSTTSNSTTNSASNSTSSTTTNSASMSLECNMLLHFIEGTETALYPEKPFMYDLVSDVLQSMSSLTLLEVQGMHNLLEYTHAYSRVQYRRVEAAYKEFSVRHTAEKLSTKLRRHGPLRKTKSLLLLSKYQHEFFTKHYNYTLLDRVISDYFLRIIPLASTELLLFTARLPQTFHKILADVPCTSSADFLRVLGSFAYPALSSSAEPGQVFVYADIAGFFNADRKGHATKELSTLLEGSSDCPTPLHTYANRHADNGFLTRDTRASGDVSLPSVDALLHAAEKLSQWEATPGREEESRFLFSGFLAPSTPQFVNFLFGEKAHHRYTFVRSLKEGAEYRGEDETEEVLYVCTRKPEHLLSALERRKTLSSAGVCLAVSALEKKWLGMPAEMFFARSAPQHPLFHALGCTEEFLPLEASAEKCLVAAQLVIVKAEESLLLSQKETSWLFSLKQSLPSSLQSTYPALCSTLCKKAAAVHALRAVSEFEKKPLEILTDIVQPEMLGIEHAKENIHLVGALGKVCLTIFNRHRRHAQTLPGTKKRASSTDSDFVKKEEEAVKAVQTEKTRSVTEVEKLARVLGLQLFAQLASAESKIEHVISLLHLLFSSTEESKSPPSCPLEDIPVQHFLPLKEQILSKFFSLQMKKSESSVRVHLKRVIESMVQEAPYCVVYSILVREDRKWRTSFLSPALRSTAYAVMEEYKSILKQAHASIPPASRFPKDVPVLTHTPGKKEASGAQPCIAKVMMEYKVLKGVNKPVLVKILGTDGCVYKELIKKNDELKQDMLSTQVFEYMNTALSHTFGTRAIKQRVRTYKIVALEKFFGVIEFVSNTEPLGGVIERLYETHCPEGMSSKQCREILQGVRTCPVGKKVEALGSVLTHYRPVLKHVFCGRGPFEYFTQRKTFTASFALASIATYILGLGDRHPQNILLDLKTKEMVNIDLNLVFDQAQLLSIPETVPFRMTQNIQQCLFVHSRMGYEQHMESMLGVLKQKKENLLVFMGILQDEPLHRWQAIQKLTSSSKLFSDYTSILERLQDKLNGIEDGFALGSRAHVQCLVQKATDLSNLASIFPGWSPWM